jgi:hypothetical protein
MASLLLFVATAAPGYASSPESNHLISNDISSSATDSCKYCLATGGGIFLRLDLVNNSIGGEFDGETILYSGQETFIVPKIKTSYGFGLAVGMGTNTWKLELGFVRSAHDFSFGTFRGTSSYNIFNIDFSYYVISRKLIRPYILVGLCVPWVVVNDGSTSLAADAQVGDETFSGVGLNIGPGLEVYLRDNLMVHTEMIFRRISYTKLNGVTKEETTYKDGLNGSGTSITIGLSYFFVPFPNR